MASFVLSGCGIRPLPGINFQPRTSLTPRNNLFKLKQRNWSLNVATSSVSFQTTDEEVSKADERGGFFDPGAPPPFKLADIQAAIPKHCWVKDPWKSMSYVVRDVVAIFGLAAVASYLDSWIVWPFYWFCQGTMFWALFVLGHDCDHGNFSDNPKLNSVMGHILHSSIMVPYHGWRISHRVHHQNQGHAENDDQSWHPMTERVYKGIDNVTRLFRYSLPFPTLVFPFYLWSIRSGQKGSHFRTDRDVFTPLENRDLLTSAACLTAMATLLVYLSFVIGPLQMLKLDGIPYWVFVMWSDSVTYLHHHDDDRQLPWYRGKECSYLRGGLSTVDRDYGWINNIHHDIGTHVIHHLVPQIPHYHLVEATEAAKPVLGKYYREPKKSGPLPFHLIGSLIRSMKKDHYVSDTGDVVYYQTDPKLNGAKKIE